MMLDSHTADRMLSGRIVADDAPPGFAIVADVIARAAAAPSSGELSKKSEAIAMIGVGLRREAARSVGNREESRSKATTRRPLARLAAATVMSGATLFGGLAAAGALPGAAQSVASNMLGVVGVDIPNPDSHAGTHPDTRGNSAAHTAGSSTSKGAAVSSANKNGVKGASTSATASNGKSHAGTHGSDLKPSAGPPTSLPNGGVPGNDGTTGKP